MSVKSKMKKPATDTAPHLIVSARAGTGKSTTILLGVVGLCGGDPTLIPASVAGKEVKIVPSPQQIAVWESINLSKSHAKSIHLAAFNYFIAEHLSASVKAFGLPDYVTASTMHSMGLKAVTSTYGRVEVCKPANKRVETIVERMLPQYADIWEIRRKRSGLLPLIVDLVGLCKMNLLNGTPEECYGLVAHHAMNPDQDESILSEAISLVGPVLEKCADVEHDRMIDFNDMIWIPIRNRLSVRKYDLFFGDEVQDWNRCQQALAKKAGHRLVLVGDERQAIYGFAGADSESMSRMRKELMGMYYCGTSDVDNRHIYADGKHCDYCSVRRDTLEGRGCVVLPLTVTRRCGKAIVEEARKIVPDFEAHDSNGPGNIRRAGLDEESVFCDQTTGSSTNRTTYHAICQDGDMVLCRLNAPLVSECFKFLKAGRKATIQGRDVGQGLVSTIKATKAETVTDLIHGLGKWVSDATAKEQAKKHPSEDRLIAINDRYDCIMAFVDGAQSVAEVLRKIESIFTDSKDSPGIKLSSVHKAKGLEAKRVFIIQTEKARMSHPMAKTKWQVEQEYNILYVAITRAIEELVYVS